MPLHLLFPLFSSVVFVLGMLLGKRALAAGASPWTTTFVSNFWMAAAWAGMGVAHGELLPLAAWWQAALVGLSFVCGQMFSFLAFTHGDATRINIVYATRGLWAVALTWFLARALQANEAHVPRRVMLLRLAGALLLTAAVVLSLLGD